MPSTIHESPSRANWVFLLQWVIISLALIPSLLFSAGTLSQPQVMPFNVIARTTLVAVITGLLIGSLQWIILRSYLPQAGWWVVATIDGFGAGYLASYLASRVIFAEIMAQNYIYDLTEVVRQWKIALVILMSITPTLLLPGMLQWLILRKQVASKTAFWPIAWLVSEIGAIGIFWLSSIMRSEASLSLNQTLLAIIGSGTVFGLITGIPLLFLLRRTRQPAEQKSWMPFSRQATLTWAVSAILILFLDSVILGLLSRPAIMLHEDFESDEANEVYLGCAGTSIEQGRLRFIIEKSFTGCDVGFPQVYEDFTLTTALFPVGMTYDGSVNISFRHNYEGWYEIQFRPAQKQVFVMKIVQRGGQTTQHDLTGNWINTPDLDYTTSRNELKLVARKNIFALWLNGTEVGHFEDHTPNIHVSGTIRIGAGAAETENIGFEYDDIRIWEP